jgi:uncharacterized protein YbjT (DUF2867 family)
MRTTIAITGALGFVAARLIPHLVERGTPLVFVVRPGRDATRLERSGEIRRADLDRPETCTDAFKGVNAIVHLSGLSQVTGLVPVLESAGVKRGVFVSSAGVHTRLVSPGSDAKRRGEAKLRASSIDYTILRPSMIYGTPADRNMARLLHWIRSNPVLLIPGNGSTLQQPIHVDDLVAAILAALDRPESARREYDVGGPEALPLREIIRLSASALGRRVHVIGVPLMPAYHLVRWARRTGLRTPVQPEQVLRLVESKAVDISSAERDLGFRPRSFADGIRDEAKDLPP